MNKLTTLVLCLFSSVLFSQEFEISGKIEDPEGNPLQSATIYTERISDTALVAYTISEKDGGFILKGNTEAEKVNFLVSFNGYVPISKVVDIQPKVEMGTLKMSLLDNALDEVTVTGSRPPISIKKDTLEFNANSFDTRPDANLEDLMKKLPGVEVDAQGNITVNGKPVSRILVNGKEFFGDDPQIATKNLPKEIIEKVQVTDTKTRSQEFTGKAGNPDDKTINIELKKDKNKGYFARATAGGGTDERYELSGIGNYFKDKMRLSILASSNNINSSGFSFDEVFDMMGRNARSINIMGNGGFSINGTSFGSQGGITKSETAGFNYANEWENDMQLNTDYFFGRNDTETRTITERENFLPDGSSFYSNSENEGNLINDSHRANLRYEVEFDTLTRLSISPRININIGQSNRRGSQENLDENFDLRSSIETREREDLENSDFQNRLDFIKRFGSRGAYLQVDIDHSHQRRKNDNFFFSENVLVNDGGNTVEIQDQYIDQDENSDAFGFEVSQRSVLKEKLFLDLNYDFNTSKSTNTRNVFDAAGGEYTRFNELLSNDFEVNSQIHTPNAGINYEGEKWRIETELGLQSTNLETNNFIQDVQFDNTYNNLYVNTDVRYSPERSKSIGLGYSTSTDVPSIGQLQPVEDRTNPLNIVTGNPELEPAYNQRFRFNFRNFDFATRSGFFAFANVNLTNNRAVAISTVDENFRRRTTYTNVDGVVNSFFNLSYSKSSKKDAREVRYRIGTNANYNHNIGFINGERFNSDQFSIGPSVRFTYAIDELLEVNTSYRLDYNDLKYDIATARNQSFTNHTVSLETTTYWPENVVFGNDISYNYYGIESPGLDNTSILWNMSLGYQFLKKNATLKLKVYDVLKQNIDTRRMAGDDYIQDVNNLILQRYGMLSFTYKFSSFGEGGGPQSGRGQRRIIRM